MLDEEQEQREREKRTKQRADREANDLREVLAHVEGRRLLARIMYKACATDSSTTLIDSSFNPDQATMAFTEGSRRFGMMIYNEIMRVSPNTLLQMRREYESERSNEETKKAE